MSMPDRFEAGTMNLPGIIGLRAALQYHAGLEPMAIANKELNPRAKTVFLQAADDFEDISSTRVREIMAKGEIPEGMLAPAVIAYIQSKKGEA